MQLASSLMPLLSISGQHSTPLPVTFTILPTPVAVTFTIQPTPVLSHFHRNNVWTAELEIVLKVLTD